MRYGSRPTTFSGVLRAIASLIFIYGGYGLVNFLFIHSQGPMRIYGISIPVPGSLPLSIILLVAGVALFVVSFLFKKRGA